MALALSAPAPSVPAASFTPALSDIKSYAQNVAGDLDLNLKLLGYQRVDYREIDKGFKKRKAED